MKKIFRAIGLMSGTSMDGIDLALIESDGRKYIKRLLTDYQPYQKDFQIALNNLVKNKLHSLLSIKQIENELTIIHANFVNSFLNKNNLKPEDIDAIGFHGQTIYHNPEKMITWQIGNGHLLAIKTKINVINDFRSRDICLGGQGAPLVPIYHFNLLNNYLKQEQKNIGVLNIGGVSNLTLFNKDNEASLTGFDVCFGNSVFDDLIQEKTKKNYDQDGKLTMKGKADIKLAKKILENEIFFRSIPRSFDRQDFTKIVEPIKALELDNALATYGFVLTKALEIALGIIKIKPEIIFICGGGRKNKGLTNIISENLVNIKFIDIDKLKLDGDSIEAEAFAFLAIRNLLDLPISFSKTTGLKKYKNSTGGIFYNKTNS